MSRYRAHLEQANSNLEFLGKVNGVDPQRYDWQVTVAFYSALHLVNAHLCDYGLRYRSHHDVREAISPVGRDTKPSALPKSVYLDYQKLFRLSRRARYLLDEASANDTQVAHTSEKHFAQAIRRLDALLAYFDRSLEEYVPLDIRLVSQRLANGDPLQVVKAQAASS